jgi:hypothetical protein
MGFRERATQFVDSTNPLSRHYGRYIAISAGLWKGGNPAPIFADFETAKLRRLLRWPDSSRLHPTFDPNYTNPNTSWLTVLAVLAHEFGHVYWYDVNVPNVSAQTYGTYNFAGLTNSCLDGKSFFANNWQDIGLNGINLQPPRWREFGERQNRHQASLGTIADLDSDIGAGNFQAAGPILDQQLEYPAPWASFFAAISPDEDFVETYTFYVLTANSSTAGSSSPMPYLSSSRVMIPYGNSSNGSATYPNIPQDYFTQSVPGQSLKAELSRKVSCIANSVAGQTSIRR